MAHAATLQGPGQMHSPGPQPAATSLQLRFQKHLIIRTFQVVFYWGPPPGLVKWTSPNVRP